MIAFKKGRVLLSQIFAVYYLVINFLLFYPAFHDLYADLYSQFKGIVFVINELLPDDTAAGPMQVQEERGKEIIIGICHADSFISNLLSLKVTTYHDCNVLKQTSFLTYENSTPYISLIVSNWSSRAPPLV